MLQSLRDEMSQLEGDLLEADAKNQLYTLLQERTRREHMEVDQQVGQGGASGRMLGDGKGLQRHAGRVRAGGKQQATCAMMQKMRVH